MYKHNLKQLEFVEFSLLFQGPLSRDNKWAKLAALIPWKQLQIKIPTGQLVFAGYPQLVGQLQLINGQKVL